MTREVIGRGLVEGEALSTLLRLDSPLSFWGGVDPASGRIIDQAHPQAGASVAGKIVAMPGSRGSSGTPGVLGESLRRGVGPVGMIVTKPDINLVAGSLAARALYGVLCPIILVAPDVFDALEDGGEIAIRSRD
jgi:predicted aconitase with swiveling domain